MQTDLIFRRAFRSPELAQLWLRILLQGHPLCDHVDWSKLRIAGAASVDPKLRRHDADLVLIAPTLCGTRLVIFVIEFAHGNKRAAWRQLLRYVAQEVEKAIAGARGTLPPIVVPILVHTGKSPFQGLRAVAPHGPQHVVGSEHAGFALGIAVEDFAARDEASIVSMPLPEPIRLAALFAQFVRGKSPDEVEANVLRWRELLLAVCGAPFDPDEAQVYATYILETTQLSAERCEMLFVEILGRDGERPMKTTADKLREEGKEVGLSQGQARVLLTQLRRRFGALTQAQQDRITTATSDQLEAIALRILDAKTIDEAIAG
jgi:hypothetical protein